MARTRSSPSKPTELVIGDIRFVVDWSTDGSLKAEHEVGRTILGSSDQDKLLITIKPGQPTSLERDTMMHEILHMALWFATLGDIVPKQEGIEEQFVCRLTPVLMMVLRQNPEIVKYLTSG